MDNGVTTTPTLPASTPPVDAARRKTAATRPSVSSNTPRPQSATPSLDVKEVAQKELEPKAMVAALDRVSKHISEYLRQIGRALEFQVDRDSDRVVILVTNKDSGELVRAIPPEEVQRLPEYLATGEPVLVDLRA